MSYIVGLINHFAALQRLAARTGARISLDASNFVLEAKLRNRYFSFFPQFLVFKDERLSHSATLVDEAIGFAGWRPYHPYSFPMATDKLLFKRYLESAGQRVPATWMDPRAAERDFVIKRSIGSFGTKMSGPFRASSERNEFELGQAASGGGEVFAEQFIEGTIVKVWYWGQRAFFAHEQAYPTVTSDGQTSLSELARSRMRVTPATWSGSPSAAVAHACIRYQGFAPDEVLAPERTAWIDYRYGRTYEQVMTRFSDSALERLPEGARTQIASAGLAAAKALAEVMPAPVAYALDAMLDREGRLWWLEMNSNPTVPPEGYAEMFADLFGVSGATV